MPIDAQMGAPESIMIVVMMMLNATRAIFFSLTFLQNSMTSAEGRSFISDLLAISGADPGGSIVSMFDQISSRLKFALTCPASEMVKLNNLTPETRSRRHHGQASIEFKK